jgi:sugar lactone lactonase YvrE
MGSLRAALVAVALAASASAQSHTFSHLAGSTGGAAADDGPAATARFNYPSAVAVDREGNVFVADTTNHTIRKISGGSVTTLAGFADGWGNRDGVGGVARFNQPGAVAVDGEGTVYVADSFNGRIRRISAGGKVTTLGPFVGVVFALAVDGEGSLYVARNAIQKITRDGQLLTIAGVDGSSGSSDGTGSAARFNDVMGLAVDATGNVYAADSGNHTIRRITPEGVVTTIAGLAGASGSSDGSGSSARFSGPHGIAVDRSGNLFVADSFNSTVRRIDPSGVVTTVAGNAGEDGGIADGSGSSARFNAPLGVAVGADDTIYVADTFNHTIRTISSEGVVETIAGRPNEPGSNDGSGSAARFFRPYDVAVDASGIVYVADSWNHTIRRITPDGVVTTLAGLPGVMGSADGKGAAARFAFPKGIAVDLAGKVYVSDSGNGTIRTITSDGTVSTLAGLAGASGSDDGAGSAARFYLPSGLTVDRNGTIYVADTGNHTIRLISPGGEVSTLAGLAGVAGSVDAIGAAARFNAPEDVALALPDPSDLHLLVADTANHTLRLVRNGGWVATYSGLAGETGNTVGGTPRSARWFFPASIAIHPDRFYVSDAGNQMIRVITGSTSGGFVGGSSHAIGSANGGGFDARFHNPVGIAVDGSGNLYVADVSNHAIRKGSWGGDEARIDKTTGPQGTVRQLSASPQAATSWRWELVRRPAGSTAELSSSTSATPSFIPDVGDIFVFRLTAQNATGTSVTHVRLTATPLPRRRAVGHGE